MQQTYDILPSKILKSSCFSAQTHQELNAICTQPLSKLGLSAFEFARVYDDGTAITMYSNHNMAKYVIENQLHITAHIPKAILKTQFWHLPESNGPYSHHLREMKELSDTKGFANYIRRFSGYYEMFCFGSSQDQSLASNQFINTKESLEQFSLDFSDRAKKLISIIDQDRFKITPAMLPNFGGILANEDSCSDELNLRLHLEKIQQELARFGSRIAPNLTTREIECIKHLILGNTANEIANAIGISQRTVEMHLNSIRNKLGCTKKSNIITTLVNIPFNQLFTS